MSDRIVNDPKPALIGQSLTFRQIALIEAYCGPASGDLGAAAKAAQIEVAAAIRWMRTPKVRYAAMELAKNLEGLPDNEKRNPLSPGFRQAWEKTFPDLAEFSAGVSRLQAIAVATEEDIMGFWSAIVENPHIDLRHRLEASKLLAQAHAAPAKNAPRKTINEHKHIHAHLEDGERQGVKRPDKELKKVKTYLIGKGSGSK